MLPNGLFLTFDGNLKTLVSFWNKKCMGKHEKGCVLEYKCVHSLNSPEKDTIKNIWIYVYLLTHEEWN